MQAIRRGTWLAVQLQTLFVCVVLLLTVQAQHYLAGLPHSARTNTLVAAVPYLGIMVVAVALLYHPWELPRKQEAARDVRSGSNQPEQEAPAETPKGEGGEGEVQENSTELGPDEGLEVEKPTKQVELSAMSATAHGTAPWPFAKINIKTTLSHMSAPLLWCRTKSLATERCKHCQPEALAMRLITFGCAYAGGLCCSAIAGGF